MPQSIEIVGLATVVLAAGTAFVAFFISRWGLGDPTDSLVLLYRKLAGTQAPKSRGRKPQPSEAWPEPAAATRMEARGRRRFGRRKPKDEGEEAEAAEEAEEAEEKEAEDEEAQTAGAQEDLRSPSGPGVPDTPARERLHQIAERARGAPVEADHVPLSDEPEPEPEDDGELSFGQRFRRGLRRTRERIGEDMRDAFARGPTPEAFDQLEEALMAADIGVATASALVDDLRERMDITENGLPAVLKGSMVGQLSEADRKLRLVRGQLSVWVVVGVNGTGKTTTIAKLAARAKGLGLEVSLAAADTFRAAAAEQLVTWGESLGVEVTRQSQGADPAAVVFDAIARAHARGHQLLIVDTAGRLHTRKPLMDELQKVVRVIERDERAVASEVLLVIDATTGQNGIAQAKSFQEAVGVTGLALAKLDGTAKGGVVFAVEKELGVPVKAVGVGEGAADLIPFDPEAFVDALVGGWEQES